MPSPQIIVEEFDEIEHARPSFFPISKDVGVPLSSREAWRICCVDQLNSRLWQIEVTESPFSRLKSALPALFSWFEVGFWLSGRRGSRSGDRGGYLGITV